MQLELHDKVAVITGGSSGIGLAIAHGLAQEKAHVVLCARGESTAKEQAQVIRQEYGVEALGLGCDVTRRDDITAVINLVEQQFGGVDILINNAGVGTNETILDAPDEKWQYHWELHVMAAVRLSRGLAAGMRRRGGGVILNNASICASQPLGHEPIYNVTKAALMMFSKCLANELIPYNIRVNCVNPGLIMTAGWIDHAKAITTASGGDWMGYLTQEAQAKAPIGRFASPQELADFFVFLCSPRASYCVGSAYYVDGGWLNVV
jgi:NAD(P)-dependent dehydrogenase (short-subunit alcohol dehydrogenase family)